MRAKAFDPVKGAYVIAMLVKDEYFNLVDKRGFRLTWEADAIDSVSEEGGEDE